MSVSAIRRSIISATASAMLLFGLAACGQDQPSPLQSPLPTAALPNATVAAVTQAPQAATPTLQQVPTVNRRPTQDLVPTADRGLPTQQALVPTADRGQPTQQALVPTVVRSPVFLPTPVGGTPDVQATSRAVIATITALAAPPTYPPTATRSRPIGAGGRARVTAVPTPTLDPSGISLLSVSSRIFPGGAGTLTIRTQPGAACLLQQSRQNSDGNLAISPVPGSASRQAGDDGIAAWIWQVNGAETPGALTLLVDCGVAGKAQVEIEVAR
jgi:predicted small lipoprotein YifL